MNEQYKDNFEKIEIFPQGKLFRLTYDPDGNLLRILSKTQTLLDEIVEAFSVANPSAFFSQQYGYAGEPTLYNINQFGYFLPGLLFDVLEWIKTQYGSLKYLAISVQCENYINDFIRPLYRYITDNFETTDIMDDIGSSDIFEKRAYQDEAVEALFKKGFGRGLIEIPTAGGKSYILANFIWNILQQFNSNAHFLIMVPNVQLVEQLKKDFCEYGFKAESIAKLRGGMSKKEKKLNDITKAQIVIANRQSLSDHINEIPKPDVLICDECLQQGSIISTINGNKKIEDIKINDLVLSFNENKQIYEYKPVEKIHQNLQSSHSYDYFLKIELDNNNILTITPNHKIYTKNKNYIRADELTFNDEIFTLNIFDKKIIFSKIKQISKISRNNESVYNLTVKDNHNYFANNILVSNCHTCLAKSTSELIQGIKAKIRIGCSGTLPRDKFKFKQLVGMFGRMVYKENPQDLQNSGFISKLKITVYNICDKEVESNRNLLFHQDSAIKYVSTNYNGINFDEASKAEHEYFAKWYGELYKPVLDKAATMYGNTLILFDKIDIGKNLFEKFKEFYPNKSVFYTDGQTKVQDRETIREDFEKSDGNILFSNVQIMSTGVSIKRLYNVVFCFSSKSTTRIIQSIGRVLRLYKGKDEANLIDCVFNTKYSQRHYKERLRLYKEFYGKNQPDEIIPVVLEQK